MADGETIRDAGTQNHEISGLARPFPELAMILQLNPPLPLTTPKGKALAHLVIDYGPEHDLMWVCILNATGECWTYANPEIRFQKNITMGRLDVSKPIESKTTWVDAEPK